MSTIASHGYVLIFVGKKHHLADIRGYAYEHRLVAESKIGRRLRKGEQVHHLDENRANNHPDNLDVKKSAAHHLVEHRAKNSNKKLPDERNPTISCKCGCGVKFKKYDASNRLRKYLSGHNPMHSPTRDFIVFCLIANVNRVRDIISIGFRGKPLIATAMTLMVKNGSIKRISHGEYALGNIRRFKL